MYPRCASFRPNPPTATTRAELASWRAIRGVSPCTYAYHSVPFIQFFQLLIDQDPAFASRCPS